MEALEPSERMELIMVVVCQYTCGLLIFFFQAEDGIRDLTVTGVQTCALPILMTRPTAPSSSPPSAADPGRAAWSTATASPSSAPARTPTSSECTALPASAAHSDRKSVG